MVEISAELAAWAIEHRRYLHQYPELSGQEFATHQYIKQQMQMLGLKLLNFKPPSLVAYLPGTSGEKTLGLRADIDALAMQEEGEKTYLSKHPGVAHTCGHDGHTAILLAVARWAVEHREQIKPNLVFIFQSAEETGPSGAAALIEQKLFDHIDEIYGLHLWQPLEKGKIAVLSGAMMASSDEFELTIHGVGGHGAMPHMAIDPVYIASQVIIGLQSIVSRKLDPLKPAVITVGKVETGTTYNVIPQQALLLGTTRAFSNNVRKWLREEIEDLASDICKAYGARAQFRFLRGTPPVVNDKVISRYATIKPSMGAEDFGFYLQEKAGAFMFVGMNSDKSRYPHHDPRFDIDEEAIPIAIKLFLSLILHRL
jgi:amidohydrolase